MSRVLVFLLAAVVVVGAVLAMRGREPPGVEVEPTAVGTYTPEAAADAEAKLSNLHLSLEEARLSGEELTSLLRYRPEVWSLGPVIHPEVRISGDTLRLNGAILTAEIPSDPQLDAIRSLLPDTATVDVTGTVRPNSTGSVMLQVYSVEVAGMPIPARYHPMILERLGPTTVDPDGATLVLPLPGPLGTARVEAGELILVP
jgi:hypothetical protein